jgi:hypothetical protein
MVGTAVTGDMRVLTAAGALGEDGARGASLTMTKSMSRETEKRARERTICGLVFNAFLVGRF